MRKAYYMTPFTTIRRVSSSVLEGCTKDVGESQVCACVDRPLGTLGTIYTGAYLHFTYGHGDNDCPNEQSAQVIGLLSDDDVL